MKTAMKIYLGTAAAAAVALTTSMAQAQTPLSAYADAKGYVDVQALTRAQLAGT